MNYFIHKYRIKTGTVVFFTISLIVFLLVAPASVMIDPSALSHDLQLDTLLNENDALQAFHEEEVTAKQTRLQGVRNNLWTFNHYLQYKGNVPPVWQLDEVNDTLTDEAIFKRFALVHRRPSLGDWLNILETVQSVEALPGSYLRSILISSSGDHATRNLDQVVIIFTLPFVRE